MPNYAEGPPVRKVMAATPRPTDPVLAIGKALVAVGQDDGLGLYRAVDVPGAAADDACADETPGSAAAVDVGDASAACPPAAVEADASVPVE